MRVKQLIVNISVSARSDVRMGISWIFMKIKENTIICDSQQIQVLPVPKGYLYHKNAQFVTDKYSFFWCLTTDDQMVHLIPTDGVPDLFAACCISIPELKKYLKINIRPVANRFYLFFPFCRSGIN